MVDYKKRCEMLEKDLEWVCEQLEYLEDTADDIRDEASKCRKTIKKIIPKTDEVRTKEDAT